MKLPANGAGLPGNAVASKMRANEISLFIGSLDPLGLSTYWVSRPIGFLDPASMAWLAGHVGIAGHLLVK